MTAEIAILNSSGIALAADSAVTIGSQKVYNSANKLFTLSKHHPVGIMVYDSADLMNVPWEIIIKEYRAELGDKSFDTLQEYANDFWEFIRTTKRAIPDVNKDNYIYANAYTYVDLLFKDLRNKIIERFDNKQEVNTEETLSALRIIIDKYNAILNERPYLDGFSNDESTALTEKWNDEFNAAIKWHLGELYDLLTDDEKDNIIKQIGQLFVKDWFILRTTGVVIAGYGTTEMFPKIASYLVEGVYDSKVRKIFNAPKSNVQEDVFVTTIVPFAQDEMVWTFLSGIDPEINQFASTYLTSIFKKYPESLSSEELGIEVTSLEKAKNKLTEDAEQLLDEFERAISDFQRKNNSQPIIDMVGVLPKDELAAMAESLVNLTVFKRKVSKAVETVGGPIDVAVISKGDGFIWVKRKHYFKPELNQHFFSNYFGKVNNHE